MNLPSAVSPARSSTPSPSIGGRLTRPLMRPSVRSWSNYDFSRRLSTSIGSSAPVTNRHGERRRGDTSTSSSRIGSGAFGRVYRAWDTRLDREVALKRLPARSDTGDASASSIIEEGRLLARVRHPNVVTIYGAERIGDTIGLWMERIDGETVEQRLARGSPLKASDAIEIGIQICHAVSAVHKAGLLHRDIKAQNVMLASDGRAVLMDFGTGRELGGASSLRRARSRALPSISHRSCFAAAMRPFRPTSTALACCCIGWSPARTRCTRAVCRICVSPTSASSAPMMSNCGQTCRVGWAHHWSRHRSAARAPLRKRGRTREQLSARSHRAHQ